MQVCCCAAGIFVQSHLASIVVPTPVHDRTGSGGTTAHCVMWCTICILCAVAHCLVLCSALHCVCLAALHLCLVGSGDCNLCYAVPHCPEAVGRATLATCCLSACGKWVVELLLCTTTLMGAVGYGSPARTASLPAVSGLCNSCNTLPHCLGAVASATPAMHCPSAWGRLAVELL